MWATIYPPAIPVRRPVVPVPVVLLVALALATPSAAQLALAPTQHGPASVPSGVMSASTKVLARDGSVLGSLHGDVDREPVPVERMPAHLRTAVVAIEDRRFWHHDGVDPRGIADARVLLGRAGYSVEMVVACPPGGGAAPLGIWQQDPPQNGVVRVYSAPAVCGEPQLR